jgi:hypothetical protein
LSQKSVPLEVCLAPLVGLMISHSLVMTQK